MPRFNIPPVDSPLVNTVFDSPLNFLQGLPDGCASAAFCNAKGMLTTEAVIEVSRVLKNRAHAYFIVTPRAAANAMVFHDICPLRLVTTLILHIPWSGNSTHWSRAYYPVLFMSQGAHPTHKASVPDVLTGNEVKFWRMAARQSTNAGDLVIDPWASSGASAYACCVERRVFMGATQGHTIEKKRGKPIGGGREDWRLAKRAERARVTRSQLGELP